MGLLWTGRVLFAVGLASLGALNFIYADFVRGLEPAPQWMPGRGLWLYASGAILVAAGAGLLVNATSRLAAIALGAVFLMWLLLFHAPVLATAGENIGAFVTPAFETLALCGAAWLLAAKLPGARPANSVLRAAARVGLYCFAISLPVFGIVHFVYHDIVANFIPAWIPERQFWAYFTGVAHAAAGLSIASGILARLAASLLAIMFALFIVLVHAPRVSADLASRQEWTSLCAAVALCGAASLVAASLARDALRQSAATAVGVGNVQA